jgi:hypothetical protein
MLGLWWRIALLALLATAVGVLGAVGSGGAATTRSRPSQKRPSWYVEAPTVVQPGIYVSQAFAQTVLGYSPRENRRNSPPVCSVQSAPIVTDIGADPHGDLIVPAGETRTVAVFQGPQLCGAQVGSFPTRQGGQPIAAVSRDALHGTIYVLVLGVSSDPFSSIAVCRLSTGCSRVLTNPAISGGPVGIALDAEGNVYMAGYTHGSSGAALVVFRNGRGKGKVITSYVNSSPGSLDVDPAGNLISMDQFTRGVGAVYVYSGCPNSCTPNGPWYLKARSTAGKVTKLGKRYIGADYANTSVDVYRYSGTAGIKYLYSFSNGLTPSLEIDGLAPTPGLP